MFRIVVVHKILTGNDMQVLEFMMEKLCNVCFIRILTVTYSTHHATILLTAVIGEIKKNIKINNPRPVPCLCVSERFCCKLTI